jgi:hypothetical protein
VGDVTYRVGHLKDPQPADPFFATVEQALIAALNENDAYAILAVWSDDGAIVCIIYERKAYWP